MNFNIETYDMQSCSIDWDDIANTMFPLTNEMCEKNDYSNMNNKVYMDKLYINNSLYGICIYSFHNKELIIYSFEISANSRYLGIGKIFLNYYLNKYNIVRLSCLPDVKIFYEKCGFIETEDCRMVYYGL